MIPASSGVTGDHVPAFAPCDWERVAILEWRQPRLLQRRWELWADGERVATLEHRGLFRRGFTAESASGRWEVLEGWFGQSAIRREGDTEPLARFRRRWLFGGKIALADGRELVFKRGGWWLARATFANLEGFEFFRVRRRFSPPRIQASVELTDSGRRLDWIEPLLLFGWALVLEARSDSAHH